MNTGRRIRLSWAGSMACFLALFSPVGHAGWPHFSSEAEAKGSPVWDCMYGFDDNQNPLLLPGSPLTFDGCIQSGVDWITTSMEAWKAASTSPTICEGPYIGSRCATNPIPYWSNDPKTGIRVFGHEHACVANISAACRETAPLNPFHTGAGYNVYAYLNVGGVRPTYFFVPVQSEYTTKLSTNANPPASGNLAEVEPGMTSVLRATVYDSNNQPQPGVSVTLRSEAVPMSGGHSHHSDDRPMGDLGGTPPLGHILENQITGPDGAVHFTFTAPKVAGDHTITANCNDHPCGTDSGKVWVGIKNLVTLDSYQYYILVGDTPNHFDNHYLTQTGLFQIHVLSTLYSAKYPNNPLLHLNDASLERGGLLDISLPWSPPHFEHCRGTEIDVRANDVLGAIPSTPEHIAEFRALARIVGADARFEIPRNSSGDFLNHFRHFHVRLLGEMPQCP